MNKTKDKGAELDRAISGLRKIIAAAHGVNEDAVEIEPDGQDGEHWLNIRVNKER